MAARKTRPQRRRGQTNPIAAMVETELTGCFRWNMAATAMPRTTLMSGHRSAHVPQPTESHRGCHDRALAFFLASLAIHQLLLLIMVGLLAPGCIDHWQQDIIFVLAFGHGDRFSFFTLLLLQVLLMERLL